MSARTRAAPGHVRIIGGRWRGTRLPVVEATGLRPTSDRVRETLFNWLQARLPDARVLDLFAGSGALGLEALSRGASEAILVERDPGAAEQLRANVERLHAGGEAHVIRADALGLLRTPLHGRFDVVFIDPPFDSGDLWRQALALLAPWLDEDAWLYLETPLAGTPEVGAPWVVHREGRTRDVCYALYRRVGDAAATLASDSRADGAATE
jgi:16S rRNA (guanine966-N2)-methyltransferase